MAVATLRLRLAGPLQSWGTRSRFTERDTANEPSKSGVLGMICAALGRSRDAALDDLISLRMGVRVDLPGRIERDYHTAANVPNTEGKQRNTVVSNRFYLADAAFLVGLEGDGDLLKRIDGALQNPRWPLFLGRKACPPTPPISLGVVESDLRAVLEGEQWLVTSRPRVEAARSRLGDGESIRLRTIIDSEPPGHEQRNDVPLSFESRLFSVRPVELGSVPLTESMLSPGGDGE